MFFHPSPRLENPLALEVRSLRGMNLIGARLGGARLNSCDFAQADLEGADLADASLGIAWQRLLFALLAAGIGMQLGLALGHDLGAPVIGFWGALLGFDLFWAASLDDELPKRLFPPGDPRRDRWLRAADGRNLPLAWKLRLPLALASGCLLQAALLLVESDDKTLLGGSTVRLLCAIVAGVVAVVLVGVAYARCLRLRTRLRAANLAGADLSGAVLTRVDLREARLVRALLVEADLRGADLTGAILAGANLTGALLDGAQVDGTDFTGAIMPDSRPFGGTLAEHLITPEA